MGSSIKILDDGITIVGLTPLSAATTAYGADGSTINGALGTGIGALSVFESLRNIVKPIPNCLPR